MSVLTLTFEELEFMTQTCCKSLFEIEIETRIKDVVQDDQLVGMVVVQEDQQMSEQLEFSESLVSTDQFSPSCELEEHDFQEDFYLIDVDNQV